MVCNSFPLVAWYVVEPKDSNPLLLIVIVDVKGGIINDPCLAVRSGPAGIYYHVSYGTLCMEITWAAVCPLRMPRGRGPSADPSSRTSTEYRNGEDTEEGMPPGNSSARMPTKKITAT